MTEPNGIQPARSRALRPARRAASGARAQRGALRLGCDLVVLDAEAQAWQRLADRAGERRVTDLWWWPNPVGARMPLQELAPIAMFLAAQVVELDADHDTLGGEALAGEPSADAASATAGGGAGDG